MWYVAPLKPCPFALNIAAQPCSGGRTRGAEAQQRQLLERHSQSTFQSHFQLATNTAKLQSERSAGPSQLYSKTTQWQRVSKASTACAGTTSGQVGPPRVVTGSFFPPVPATAALFQSSTATHSSLCQLPLPQALWKG